MATHVFTAKDLTMLNRKQLLKAIRLHWKAKGFSPSVRDLVEMTTYRSTGAVNYALRRLREDGAIDFVDNVARSITLKEE